MAKEKPTKPDLTSTLGEWLRSDEEGEFERANERTDKEEINLPGQLLPGEGIRLSNTPDALPELITALRKMKGMTQADLGEAIGYPAPVIGNIEQGRRKLGLKTLSDLFAALGGELYIEYRQK